MRHAVVACIEDQQKKERKERRKKRPSQSETLNPMSSSTSSLKVPVVKSRGRVGVGVRKKNAPQQQICVMNARVVVESHAPFAAHDGHMRLSSTHVVVVTEDDFDFDDDRSE